MTRYSIEAGPPPELLARVDDGKPKRLLLIQAESPAWRIDVAMAVLRDVLQDEDRALMLKTRFADRVMREWKIGQPRGVSEQTVRDVVTQIERTAAAAAPMRRMAERERFVPDVDRLSPGMAGNTPALKPNLPKRTP